MQARFHARTVAAIAVLAVLAAGCSGYGSSSTPPAGDTTTSAVAPTGSASESDTLDVTGASSAEVEADNFYFSPSTLVGSPGETLTITVKNEGSAPHTFTIDGTDVDVEVQPGEEQDVEVTFPDSGSTEFSCRFHEGSGMTGELTVG